MKVFNDYWAWAQQEKARMYVATPLLAFFLLALAWSVLSWLFGLF